MRVAVISTKQIPCGKTSLIYTLAGVYSRSQSKVVSVYTLGDDTINSKVVTTNDSGTGSRSASIFKAMINTKTIETKDFKDYGNRVGREEVYLYDFFNSTLDERDKQELFLSCLLRDTSNLQLIEVDNPKEEFSQRVISECDIVLLLFDTSLRSLTALKEYEQEFPKAMVNKTGYICSKYSPNVISEKKMATIAGLKLRNMLQFPYNSLIAKESLEGTLDTICKYIVEGHYELVNLRPKLQEIMQYIFDMPSNKVIKDIKNWGEA